MSVTKMHHFAKNNNFLEHFPNYNRDHEEQRHKICLLHITHESENSTNLVINTTFTINIMTYREENDEEAKKKIRGVLDQVRVEQGIFQP